MSDDKCAATLTGLFGDVRTCSREAGHDDLHTYGVRCEHGYSVASYGPWGGELQCFICNPASHWLITPRSDAAIDGEA